MTLPFLQSDPGDDPVIVEGVFKASPERVFRAWTTPEEVMKWFGRDVRLRSAEIDLRVGGAWRFVFPSNDGVETCLTGEYLEIEPGRRLVFSWRHERAKAAGEVDSTPESQVAVDFASAPNGARVRLEHSRIGAVDGRKGVGGGWSESFGRIQSLVEAKA